MDFVDRCKNKLEHFRIKELKDILARVGISKQGRKQDLMDRVLAVLYDEGSSFLYKHINGKEDLVAIIDDAYRKMQNVGVNDSNAKKQNSAKHNLNQLQEEAESAKVRCVCGHSGVVDVLIQCAGPNCNISQHTGCALISEQDTKKHSFETQFFCQTCRVERADPFWETIDHLLYPVKLSVINIPAGGAKPFRHIEKTFELSKANKDLLVKAEYEVQVWSMLLSDSVPFRVQWPQFAELFVNDVPFRTYNRPGSQPLGANGRDDGVKITLFLVDGVNKISLSSGYDDRDFCLGVRLVKKLSHQQILSMIPQESVGESFEDALTRVKRCSGGRVVAENEDSDSDLEVVMDSITVSLRCPMSGCRMKTAVRFKPCIHMGCFDLETFVQLNERSRKWQCPVCLKNYSLENLTIDPYFNRILNMMRDCREETSEIELKPDGSWRVKNEVAIKDLSLWHYPDGSLSNPSEPSKSALYENLSGKHDNTTPGMQKNTAARSVGQSEDTSQLIIHDTNFHQEVITMSSSSSEDHRDDVVSFEKYGDHQIGNSGHIKDEVNSISAKRGMLQGNGNSNSSVQLMDTDIIILSDSEEDDISLVQHDSSTTTVGYDTSRILSTALPESADPHPGLSSTWMSDSSNRTNDDVRTPQLPFAPNATTHSLDSLTGFDPPDIIPSLVNGCMMATVDNGHSGNQVVDSSFVPDNVIASTSFAQDIVTSFDGNLDGQNCLTAATDSGNMNPVHNATPPGEGSFREGSCSYEGESCNGVEARVQPTGTSQQETLFYVRSKKRLSLASNTNGESCLEQDDGRKRTGDPFSFPRQRRSGRR